MTLRWRDIFQCENLAMRGVPFDSILKGLGRTS